MLASLPPAPPVVIAVPSAQVLSPEFGKLQLPVKGLGCGPLVYKTMRPPFALHGCRMLNPAGQIVVYVETVPLSATQVAALPASLVSR